MAVASVTERLMVFSFADPRRAYARVALDCDDAIPGRRRFRRTAAGWSLSIPRPSLSRVEYRLLLTSRDGSVEVVCDPSNPERVRTAFGERSVVLLPGYVRPSWLEADAPEGRTVALSHQDADLGELPIVLWSPEGLADDTPAPLLLAHDGPEYADLSSLTRYAAAMVDTGTLTPFRVALMQPVERDEWYAANPAYVRAEIDAVETVRQQVAVAGDLAVMGASLGGLSALLVGLAGRPTFGAVFSQSGSFFQADLDEQESGYPHFDRVVAAVRDVTGADGDRTARRLAVTLTCGKQEENFDNNAAMARALEAFGHRVRLVEGVDLHNYTAWRDSLDPALTDLLLSVWGAEG
jgi:enterochelin esterase family protein